MAQSLFIRPGQSVPVAFSEGGATVYASGATVSYSTGSIASGSSATLYGTDTLTVDPAAASSVSVTIIALPATSSSSSSAVTVAGYIDGVTTRHMTHRGVGRMHMENSLEALTLADRLGQVLVDGGDWQQSSDAKGVSSHDDPVLSGQMTGPGSASFAAACSTITAAQFRAMTIRNTNYAYKNAFTNILSGTPFTVDGWAPFMKAHPKMVSTPELKVSGAGGPELLAAIQANGLEKRTIVASFNLPDLAIFKAAGIAIAWYRTTTAGYTLAAAQAASLDYLGYSYTDSTWIAAPGLAAIQAAYDAGIKLAPFTFQRRHQVTDEAARVGRPLAWVTSDFGVYTGKTVGITLTDRYSDGVPFPGQIPSSANPGTFTRSTSGKFSIVGASRVLQGWACADVTDWATGTAYAVNDVVQQDTGLWVCNTAHTASAAFTTDTAKWTVYKLTFTTTFETVGAAGSTGIVVACACASDKDVTSGTTIQDSGILLTIKKDGTSAIQRFTSGVSRQTSTGPANNSGGAVARVDGATEQWTIEFLTGANAGKVKVTNVAAGTSVTQTDNATGGTTPRRGYLTFGTTAADLDVSFSGVALT